MLFQRPAGEPVQGGGQIVGSQFGQPVRPSLEDVYLTLTDGAAPPAAQPVGAGPARRRGWRRS